MLQSHFTDELVEAGCDEAGRGCLAGPVFAAAVIFPKGYRHPVLNDSKQLTKAQRVQLREEIRRDALAWAVAYVDEEKIDEINILNASFLAIGLAVEKLPLKPQLLLIDGNRFHTPLEIPFRCIVKGDGKFLSIAAASVLAKTYRDEYMERLHREFPSYDWIRNKGYPTPKHWEAISLHGITRYHRRSFRLEKQMKLLF
ncbi:MAG: ribonuclease HII [bacterium]